MNFKPFFKQRSLNAELFRANLINEFRKHITQTRWHFIILFFGSLIVSTIITIILLQTSMNREAAFMAGIFIFAALLWATEALPLFATAILIFGLEVIFLANPGGWENLGFANGHSPSYKVILLPLSSPILILFFGGFVLAHAAVKQGIDRKLAGIVLKFFGSNPFWVILGMMLITAVFSMWMSNTATAAMMITLVTPMLAQLPKDAPIRKAFILAIPFAANIGGMGTPIGTPPNAVALGFLKDNNIHVGFLEWMGIAIPLVIFLLIITWLLLWFLYKPKIKNIYLNSENIKIKPRGWYVILIFTLTVLLWLTEKIHHLPSAVVAMLPAIAFTVIGLIERKDINRLEWHILILIAAGIALGKGMQMTGLDKILIGLLPQNSHFTLFIMSLAAIVFSTFMSNTAAANLLLPIGISFALNFEGSHEATIVGISIALSASLAMSLPISTPPNAIAYSKGEITTKDFIKIGLIIGIIGLLLVLVLSRIVINFFI